MLAVLFLFNKFKNANMITTVDKVVKKRGEIVYELAYCKGYIPLKSIVHVSVQNEFNGTRLPAYSRLAGATLSHR